MKSRQESITDTQFLYRLGRAIIRPYLRVRHRPVITGLENIPDSGAVLLVSNHLASLDTVLIPSFATRQVHFLAKEALFKTRFRNYIMRAIGAVPVRREVGDAATAALSTGKRVLERGHVFAVFPEGSRSKSGKLNKGRSGAAWLALETNATVIPIGLKGTNRRLREPHQSHVQSDNRVQMRVGPAVKIHDLKSLPAGKARREATERIMQAIAALSGQERSGSYAEIVN